MGLAATQYPNRERELLSLLFGLNEQMSRGANLEELLEQIATATCRLSGAESTSVMLLDETRSELLCRASQGLAISGDRVVFRMGEGIAGWVAQTGTPLLIADVREDPRFVRLPDQPEELRSICCVPMLARSGVIGVVTAASPNIGQFDDDDREFLSYLAAAIAKDVENAGSIGWPAPIR